MQSVDEIGNARQLSPEKFEKYITGEVVQEIFTTNVKNINKGL